MSQKVVHHYNVITGKIACGIDPRKKPEPKFSVFEMDVSCPRCRNGKPNRKDGKEKAES